MGLDIEYMFLILLEFKIMNYYYYYHVGQNYKHYLNNGCSRFSIVSIIHEGDNYPKIIITNVLLHGPKWKILLL
jgi:hypothetical protein